MSMLPPQEHFEASEVLGQLCKPQRSQIAEKWDGVGWPERRFGGLPIALLSYPLSLLFESLRRSLSLRLQTISRRQIKAIETSWRGSSSKPRWLLKRRFYQALRSHFKATFLGSCICSVIAEIALPSTISSNAFFASSKFCPLDRMGFT